MKDYRNLILEQRVECSRPLPNNEWCGLECVLEYHLKQKTEYHGQRVLYPETGFYLRVSIPKYQQRAYDGVVLKYVSASTPSCLLHILTVSRYSTGKVKQAEQLARERLNEFLANKTLAPSFWERMREQGVEIRGEQ